MVVVNATMILTCLLSGITLTGRLESQPEGYVLGVPLSPSVDAHVGYRLTPATQAIRGSLSKAATDDPRHWPRVTVLATSLPNDDRGRECVKVWAVLPVKP